MGRYRLIRSAAVAALLVAPIACGSDDDSTSATTAPGGGAAGAVATDKVDVKDFKFSPKDITVKAGTTVTWTFVDDSAHNVQLDNGSYTSKNLKDTATEGHAFPTAGSFPYKCGIHNSMVGSVTVT